MKWIFYKYQGTGNDFVIFDNRSLLFNKEISVIKKICNRQFGIGADGLILLENHPIEDFEMVYFNANGNIGSMCGNGGRCISSFARLLEVSNNDMSFMAADGVHKSKVMDDKVILEMQPIYNFKVQRKNLFIDTGSPHYIELVDDVELIDIEKEGKRLKNLKRYAPSGTNVNFVQCISGNTFKVRTYERGVEGETLSCGTGVTAVAVVMSAIGKTTKNIIKTITKGGELKVGFERKNNDFINITLESEVQFVFKGEISI